MIIIKIDSRDEVPTIESSVEKLTTVTIRDRHSDGKGTIEITGFWVINDERLAIDIGDIHHCLNEVCIGKHQEIELGTSSVAGVYNPSLGEYTGNKLNNVTARLALTEGDTMNTLYETYIAFLNVDKMTS